MDRNWKLGDDLYNDNNVLDPLTFDDIIITAQSDSTMYHANNEEERKKVLKTIFEKLLRDRARESRWMLEHNFSEIIDEVFPDEKEKKKIIETEGNMPLTIEQREALAKEIYDLLLKNEMWIDVAAYYNGKCISTSDGKHFNYNGEPFVKEANPYEMFEYVRKPNILSMTFEGTFYEVMNDCLGDYGNKIQKEFSDILAKYGLYYELGHAWNLSCYER